MTAPSGSWRQGTRPSSWDVGGKPERITVDRLKPAHQALDQPVVLATAPREAAPPLPIRPTRAAQVPFPDVAPQTTAATLPRTRAGRDQAPVKLMLPVFVNSGGL
ncbi:hypothetical protein AAFF_G00076800 [Aldrovandia affinis]|uniref:Uncharacterized protein n=1 Tax=Aldrovandia affinis TaxID=143900 RepID=A0AAD7S0D6_9TELE|nr:hypothetical protein AAFF_G00076800 [Aldrovandia affinis]